MLRRETKIPNRGERRVIEGDGSQRRPEGLRLGPRGRNEF